MYQLEDFQFNGEAERCIYGGALCHVKLRLLVWEMLVPQSRMV